MIQRAIFLDRDGTINEDPGYIKDPDVVKLIDGAGDALSDLQNKMGYKLIVISNQAGVAKGLMQRDDVERVNEKINSLLAGYHCRIDAFYYCPFHPDFDSPDLSECRKPSPKMIIEAAREHNIDLSVSFMIGDMLSDVGCGKNAGVRTILLRTGHGREQIEKINNSEYQPDFVAEDLQEAVKIISKVFNEN